VIEAGLRNYSVEVWSIGSEALKKAQEIQEK
jgi:hypothetical protein